MTLCDLIFEKSLDPSKTGSPHYKVLIMVMMMMMITLCSAVLSLKVNLLNRAHRMDKINASHRFVVLFASLQM